MNTARGGIIDETASGRSGARNGPGIRIALEHLPRLNRFPADSPLRDLPNTILTPHMLGHTVESPRRAAGWSPSTPSMRILAGEPPLYVRNPRSFRRGGSRWSRSEESV